jgi:acetate---CoA ligase (ADP-forming)
MSHSGSVAGSYAAHVAAFERAGIVTVDAYEELVETAAYFAKAKPSRGGGVGVVAAMGGTVVIACGSADKAGISLPPLAESTHAKLAELVPGYGVIGNPTDITARPGSAGWPPPCAHSATTRRSTRSSCRLPRGASPTTTGPR